MAEPRHEGGGLIANRFKPIRVLRPNVLHARDGRRHVAIELVTAADHDLRAMRKTVAIANQIDHPNLCRPREVLEHADQLVIVTELVEGVSIADRLMVGPFDPLQVGALMVELLSVLTRIHREGLAHGEISPTTVMIDANGLVRLIDLGVVRGPHQPTPRRDLEGVGALAATMLVGHAGAVPGQLLAWIARCSDPVRPFPDAATAAAGLITPEVVSTETPRGRTRTLQGLNKKLVGPAKPERSESSVAIKIPTLDEPTAKPLEVVVSEPAELRRGRTPSAMVRISDVIALAETLDKPAEPAQPAPEAEPEPEPEPEPDAKPATLAVSPPARRARLPWLAGSLAAAMAVAVLVVWWTTRSEAEQAPPPPSAVWVSEPLPRPPAGVRTPPPLPTGAVIVPDHPVPVTIRLDDPPAKPSRTPSPTTPAAPAAGEVTTLEVAFSPDSAWIETPGVYVLEEAFRQLTRRPVVRLEIVGYSSADGETTRNTQLAIGRALAVKKALVDRGVDEARISILAKPNTADRNSRRAELRFF